MRKKKMKPLQSKSWLITGHFKVDLKQVKIPCAIKFLNACASPKNTTDQMEVKK